MLRREQEATKKRGKKGEAEDETEQWEVPEDRPGPKGSGKGQGSLEKKAERDAQRAAARQKKANEQTEALATKALAMMAPKLTALKRMVDKPPVGVDQEHVQAAFQKLRTWTEASKAAIHGAQATPHAALDSLPFDKSDLKATVEAAAQTLSEARAATKEAKAAEPKAAGGKKRAKGAEGSEAAPKRVRVTGKNKEKS